AKCQRVGKNLLIQLLISGSRVQIPAGSPIHDLCLGRNFVMQTTTKMMLAICCIGAVAVETLAPVYAQHRHRIWNGCPRGWTVQGGNSAAYRWGGGPHSGGGCNGWAGGWNGCG